MIEYIKTFKFKSEYDFWILIEEIMLKYCTDDSQYVFGFDQYNDSNDYNGHLNKLKAKFKDKDNIKFVVFSSMNESDIRKLKIQKLFYDDIISEDEQYIELDNICDNKEISISLNLEQIEIWIKLGYSLKSLMEIKNSKDLQIYLENKRINLTYKIISFFTSEKEIDNYYNKNKNEIIKIPIETVNKILSFSTRHTYKKNDILKIIDNIPFRYFNIIKINGIYYKINFGFPSVKEIMNHLYTFIISKYEYSTLKSILNNNGSGISTIFEMKVIFRLLPNKDKANIFYNFIINESVKVESFLKKSNETKKNKIERLKDNANYIIEQDIFGKKDLDCLIINIIDSVPYIYGFQISIYKPWILTKSYLEKSINDMINNLFEIFKIKIEKENIYFGYIFDYSRIKDPNYSSMLKDCKNNNYKYCFFKTEKEILCNINGKEINDINEITSCPFTNKQRNKKIIINNENNLLINSFIEIIPSKLILKNIMNIISQDLKKAINDLKYKGEKMIGPNILENMILIKMLDFDSSALIIYSKNNNYVIKVIKNNKIIEARNMIELGKYLVYEIN